MSATIRVATVEDAVHVSNVVLRSIVECCQDDHRGEATSLDAWLRNKTPDNITIWLQSPDLFALVAVVENETVGFAMSSRRGHVLLCYLVPEVQHAGVGKAMLIEIEEQAKRDGIGILLLESTRTARPFYLRNGFVESGSPITAFGMDSFPMQKVLTQAR